VLISIEGTDKNQLEPGQESIGDIPVLSHCSLLRIPWPKPIGVLAHCREGEIKTGSPFAGGGGGGF
jgi:hypothetical protein